MPKHTIRRQDSDGRWAVIRVPDDWQEHVDQLPAPAPSDRFFDSEDEARAALDELEGNSR